MSHQFKLEFIKYLWYKNSLKIMAYAGLIMVAQEFTEDHGICWPHYRGQPWNWFAFGGLFSLFPKRGICSQSLSEYFWNILYRVLYYSPISIFFLSNLPINQFKIILFHISIWSASRVFIKVYPPLCFS